MTNALFLVALIAVVSAIGGVVAEPKTPCPSTGIVSLAHKRSCTKFYMCFDGKAVLQKCAEGLSFDQNQQNCVLESEAKCMLDVCPADEVGVVEMIPHPENCSKYFACTRGQGFELTCGGDLLFNRFLGSCDLPEHVSGCGLDEDSGEEEAKPICPETGVVTVPHDSECNKYYLCIDGREVAFKCTGDLTYDIRTKTCNHPQISRCALNKSNQ